MGGNIVNPAYDAAIAWLDTLTIKEIGGLNRPGKLTFEQAFLAGAAWQREQSAKIAERDCCSPCVAKAIREHANQEDEAK